MGAYDSERRQPDAKLAGAIEVSVEDDATDIVVRVAGSMLQPKHVDQLRMLETVAAGTRLQLRFVLVDRDPAHVLESASTHDDQVNDIMCALGPAFNMVRILQGKSLEQIAEALSSVMPVSMSAADIEAFEQKKRSPSMSLFIAWCMVLQADPSEIMRAALSIARKAK